MSKQSLPVPSSHIPMRVVQVLRFPYGAQFPICPSCGITLEREYQQYCDRCGQCLSWKFFCKAQIISWSGMRSGGNKANKKPDDCSEPKETA